MQLAQHSHPFYLASGLVVGLCWSAVYALVIRDQRRAKLHGMPIFCVCLNLSWEILITFVFPLEPPYDWASRIWLAIDVVLFAQVVVYGKSAQDVSFLRRWFRPLVLGLLVLTTAGSYVFIREMNDPNGVILAHFANLAMSCLWPLLALRRPDLRALSLPVAWVKMIGTLAAYPATYLWWPTVRPGHGGGYGVIAFLSVVITLFDVAYVCLLYRMKRARAPVPSMHQAFSGSS